MTSILIILILWCGLFRVLIPIMEWSIQLSTPVCATCGFSQGLDTDGAWKDYTWHCHNCDIHVEVLSHQRE